VSTETDTISTTEEEVTKCSKKCRNGGKCVAFEGRNFGGRQEFCNCTLDFGGDTCAEKIGGAATSGGSNPCRHTVCLNGGFCIATKPPISTAFHAKCVCPKTRAGLLCEKPDLCLDRCLNGGSCHWSKEDIVSCACPPGFRGDRCQDSDEDDDEGASRHHLIVTGDEDDDVRGVGVFVKVVCGLLAAAGSLLLVVGLAALAKKYLLKGRLGRAFKHRRMAESLVGGEGPNDGGGGGGHLLFPMQTTSTSSASNFINPVYENAFGNDAINDAMNDANGGAFQQLEDEDTLLLVQNGDSSANNQNHQLIDLEESESSDLLTERHRGDIRL